MTARVGERHQVVSHKRVEMYRLAEVKGRMSEVTWAGLRNTCAREFAFMPCSSLKYKFR
jgi:hypothetical protein